MSTLGGCLDVGDPDDALPRDVGRSSARCSRDPSRVDDLLCAVATACLDVSTGPSGLSRASVLPRAVSRCPLVSGDSSRGDLLGV